MACVGFIHAHGPICHPAIAVSFSDKSRDLHLEGVECQGHSVRQHLTCANACAHLPSLLPVPSTSSPSLSTYVTAPCRVRLHACQQDSCASRSRGGLQTISTVVSEEALSAAELSSEDMHLSRAVFGVAMRRKLTRATKSLSMSEALRGSGSLLLALTAALASCRRGPA